MEKRGVLRAAASYNTDHFRAAIGCIFQIERASYQSEACWESPLKRVRPKQRAQWGEHTAEDTAAPVKWDNFPFVGWSIKSLPFGNQTGWGSVKGQWLRWSQKQDFRFQQFHAKRKCNFCGCGTLDTESLRRTYKQRGTLIYYYCLDQFVSYGTLGLGDHKGLQ